MDLRRVVKVHGKARAHRAPSDAAREGVRHLHARDDREGGVSCTGAPSSSLSMRTRLDDVPPTWLTPTETTAGPWRLTLFWQLVDGKLVCAGAVILSAEPGGGTAGQPFTPDILDQLNVWRRVREGRYAVAANIYRQALEDKRPPAQAVADTLGLATGSATNLVMRARQLDYLPATRPGVPAA